MVGSSRVFLKVKIDFSEKFNILIFFRFYASKVGYMYYMDDTPQLQVTFVRQLN